MLDLIGNFHELLRRLLLRADCQFWSIILMVECMCKGIKFGVRPKSWGRALLHRFPGSIIEFGDRLRLNSSKQYNLIGVWRPCQISTLTRDAIVVVGRNCGMSGVAISSFVEIRIGDNVKCGANVTITDSDWHLNDPRSRGSKGVFIGDNVWLGMNSVILKGVSIGNNSIIGAGSVVASSIPENAVAAGNPCRVIRYLSREEMPMGMVDG